MRKLFNSQFNRNSRIFRGGAGSAFAIPSYEVNPPPTPPTNFRLVSKIDTTITVTNAESGDFISVQGYRYWKDSSGVIAAIDNPSELTSNQRITLLDGAEFTPGHTYTGLSGNTEYNLYVTAFNASGDDSDFSAILTVTTDATITAPTNDLFVCTNTAVNDTVSGITQWKTSGTGVIKWIVQPVVADAGNPWAGDTDGIPDPSNPAAGTWVTTKPTSVDLGSDGTFDVYSAVQNNAGLVSNVLSSDDVVAPVTTEGAYYAAFSTTIAGYYPVTTIQYIGKPSNPLVPPTSVTLEAIGSSSATVTWTRPTNLDGYTNFTLEVSEDGGAYSTSPYGSATIPLTSTSFSLTGLTEGTLYAVKMTSISDAATSGYSNISSGTTSTTAAHILPPPTNVTLEKVSNSLLRATYRPPAVTGDTAYYNIYNKSSGSAVFMNTAPKSGTAIDANGTLEIYLNVSPGGTYYIIMRADFGDGEEGSDSTQSESVTTTVDITGAIIYENWEDGQLNAGVSNSNGFFWKAPKNCAVTTERSYGGTYSERYQFITNSSTGHADAEQGFYLGTHYPELWMQYYIYVPSDYYHKTTGSETGTYNNKGFLHLWGCSTAPGGNCYQDGRNDLRDGPIIGPNFWPQSNGQSRVVMWCGARDAGVRIYDGHYHNRAGYAGLAISTADFGHWLKIKIHAKIATFTDYSGLPNIYAIYGDGIYELWKTNLTTSITTKLMDIHDGPWWSSSPDGTAQKGFNIGYLLGYANSGFATSPMNMYIDNISFATKEADLG